MECVIPGANMKLLGKAVQALSKIGDEVFLVAKEDCLKFQSVNMTTTAYCIFRFFNSFFSSYEMQEANPVAENEDGLSCKIPMKAILGVFRSHGHKEKKPEFCKIVLEHNPTKIVFKLKYKHEVTTVRSLHLNDGQIVHVNYDTNLTPNEVGAPPILFTQVLSSFQTTDDDMSIEVTPTKAFMRNYIAGDTKVSKGIRSQIALTIGEFTNFKVQRDTTITFSLRPFRAAVQFAEMFSLNLHIDFDTSGKPAVFIVRSPTFEANFIVATLRNDDTSQSSLSSGLAKKVTKPSATPQKKPDNVITVQDQQAVNAINWEADFDAEPPEKSCKENDYNSKNVEKGDEELAENEQNCNEDDELMVPNSPQRKRIKNIFGRCYENTFYSSCVTSEILAPDSDPE